MSYVPTERNDLQLLKTHEKRAWSEDILNILQWWILILVSFTIIFQHVLLPGLVIFPECMGRSDFLRLMDVLTISFVPFQV